MKKPGATTEFVEERADDLLRARREYMLAAPRIVMSELYRAVVEMPARRFYVSDTRASEVVSAMLRGSSVLDTMCLCRREMYLEIHRRVVELMEARPGEALSRLVAEVVEQPAPKFYLTPGTAKTMICKARKKRRKRTPRR